MKPQIRKVISILGKKYPDPRTELHFETPHQLLVATMLSAQCTDKRVNLVTEVLFRKYKDVAAFARAAQEEMEVEIRSTGFYRNKAKNIIAASRLIMEKFGGQVPEEMEELLVLPGVARKTANVVLSEAFGKQAGIAVDTHVTRLAGRLGLTESDDPRIIERELMASTERADWSRLSNLLILHGRNTCIARHPRCTECPLRAICPAVDK